MHYTYETEGVCATRIEIELEGNIVQSVEFADGCDGNLKAVARLVAGMTVEDVQARLAGLTCDDRPTSCSDQLVRALTEAYAIESESVPNQRARALTEAYAIESESVPL